MYAQADLDWLGSHPDLDGPGSPWVPEGDDRDPVRRALASALAEGLSFVSSLKLPACSDPPVISVLDGEGRPDAFVTSPRRGRPIVCVTSDLAYGLAALLQDAYGTEVGRSARAMFQLTWALRFIIYHEVAHLGFGHFEESRDPRRSEATMVSPSTAYDRRLTRLAQEAESDLWATHTLFRTLGGQFYQVLTEPGERHGRPFSDHLLTAQALLFCYLHRNATSVEASVAGSYPHPQVRAVLCHWYAQVVASRIDYFLVDWRAASHTLAQLAESLQLQGMPTVLLPDQDAGAPAVKAEVDRVSEALRQRQRATDEYASRVFRLDL